MAGTVIGGKAAAATNLKRYGKDFYKNIGRKGGLKGTTGGFAVSIACRCAYIDEPHLKRQCAGAKGGTISRRGKT